MLELSEFGESIEVARKRIVVDVTMCGVYADHMSDGIGLPRMIDRLGCGLARRHFFLLTKSDTTDASNLYGENTNTREHVFFIFKPQSFCPICNPRIILYFLMTLTTHMSRSWTRSASGPSSPSKSLSRSDLRMRYTWMKVV